jgi:hypothetical protein
MILLRKNAEIADVIESLVDQESIRIPATEVRDAGLTYGPKGWFWITSHCSRLGIRSVSSVHDWQLAMAACEG